MVNSWDNPEGVSVQVHMQSYVCSRDISFLNENFTYSSCYLIIWVKVNIIQTAVKLASMIYPCKFGDIQPFGLRAIMDGWMTCDFTSF